jgi:kynurenine formamidase
LSSVVVLTQAALVSVDGVSLQIDLARPISLALSQNFDGHAPRWYAAPAASSQPLTAPGFSGSVAHGASCNCKTLHLTPHCDGTHTECVGHLTLENLNIHEVAPTGMLTAALISVRPIDAGASGETSSPPPQAGDHFITRSALAARWPKQTLFHPKVLVIRTLPNEADKRSRDYTQHPAAYLSREAAEFLVMRGVEHLVLDLPSCDRADDQGQLCAHRVFFGLPFGSSALAEARRAHCTITELAFIDNAVSDGCYLMSLQMPAIAGDALPSRPMLYALDGS